MGGWANGPGMIQEPELEEGEACYYKDDINIDPDIALSYIGDKVQSILGHLQKDFEGGVSAENLGAKFGGYGSFLPVYQRSPCIRSQPKSPQRVQDANSPGSPNHLCPEGPASTSVMVPDAPSTQRTGCVTPSSMRPSQSLKNCSGNASVIPDTSLSSKQIAETIPDKVELPSSKLDKPTNRKTLKVRIKVGADRMAQYNAEIDSLGLASPLSSAESSPEESGELSLESHETPYESPSYILQMMTSFPVPGGLLLSPLSEDLLNLVKETESSVENEYEGAHKSSVISDKILNTGGLGHVEKSIDNCENFEKSENVCMADLNECKSNNSGSRTLGGRALPIQDLNYKSLSDTARKSEKDVQVKKRKGSKDMVKGRAVTVDLIKATSLERTSDQSLNNHEVRDSRCKSVEKVVEHQARTPHKDVSSDQGMTSGNRNSASFKVYSEISEGKRVKEALDNSIVKITLQPASGEQEGLEMPRALSKLPTEKRPKESQIRGSCGPKPAADNLRDGGCAALKNKYSGKDVKRVQPIQKDAVDTSLVHKENQKLVMERPGVRPKNSNIEGIKLKPVYADNLKERSSNRNYFDNLTMSGPPAAAVLPTEGVIPGSEQIAPVDDWVCCDRCQKWRLLPIGRKSEELPDNWFCSMLDWLPGMNRCDISEELTNKTVQAPPLVPFPENQSTFQAHADRTMFDGSSTGACHLAKDHLSLASGQIADKVKKQKLKEKPNSVGMRNPVTSYNGKKKLHLHAVKNGRSTEVNQPGENAAKESILHRLNKSATVLPQSKKRKDEHVIGGDDSNPRKKIRKESFQHADGMVTKIKPKDAVSGGKLDMSGHILTSGSPSKASLKDGKKKNPQKDANSGGMGKIQISLKKQIKTCNEREVFTKKRKLMSDEDSQHQVEILQNSKSNLQQRNISTGTEVESGGLYRHKKSRVSQIEEKEHGTYKDDVRKRKSAEAGVGLLGNIEHPIYKGIQKKQIGRKSHAEPQLTLDDIVKLKQDLGCEQLATAATSSSSKVSDSRRNRVSYMEVRGSPEESVSSSPARKPCPNQVSPMMVPNVGKVNSRVGDFPAIGSMKKFLDVNEGSEMGIARKAKTTGVSCPRSSGNPTLDFQVTDARENSRGALVSGVKLRSDFVNSPFVDNESNLKQRSQEGISKDRNDTMLPQQNSREKSSLRSMDKNRKPIYERMAENPSTSSEAFYSKNKLEEERDAEYHCHAPQNEGLVDVRHHFSDDSVIKSVRSNVNVGKRDSEEWGESRTETHSTRRGCDKNYAKSDAPCSADVMQKNLNHDVIGSSVEETPGQKEPWSGKLRIKHALGSKGSLKSCSMDSRPFGTSVISGASKALKDTSVARHQNGVANCISHNEAEQSMAPNTSLANKNVSSGAACSASREAEVVLGEAEELRAHADLIKNSGFGSESTYEYFKAGLKFLHGASLLEALNGESSKHVETNTLQMYSTAAKLCKTCALEYERGHEMAAASLAYKCVEVSYLRVVYCKSSSHRVWHDLQSDLKMVPQGESPSSSASDVDNLNNLVMADKTTLSKGKVSHSGNPGKVAPFSKGNFVRLLDFTNDVSSAMEAAKKSQDIFAAACAKFKESGNQEGIVSIKRVIDFSFQDVAEFMRLIWTAFNTINRQGLSG